MIQKKRLHIQQFGELYHELLRAGVTYRGRGRPRQDVRAKEALVLHQAGKSWRQIAAFQTEKYGKKTTPEAVRKLAASRKPKQSLNTPE
jgi:hypothetical protein